MISVWWDWYSLHPQAYYAKPREKSGFITFKSLPNKTLFVSVLIKSVYNSLLLSPLLKNRDSVKYLVHYETNIFKNVFKVSSSAHTLFSVLWSISQKFSCLTVRNVKEDKWCCGSQTGLGPFPFHLIVLIMSLFEGQELQRLPLVIVNDMNHKNRIQRHIPTKIPIIFLWMWVYLIYQFRHTHTDTNSLCNAEPSQPEGIQDLWMIIFRYWFVLVICDPTFAREQLIYSRRQIKMLGSLLHSLWPVNRMWDLLACRSLRKVTEDHKVI